MADIDHFDDDTGEEEEDKGAPEGDEGDPVILVVVGAHLRAEAGDRPLAYRVKERMVAWLRERFGAEAAPMDSEDEQAGLPCTVTVCTDVLYLNDAGLRVWPTVSVGGPGVNALSAFLGDKLPSVFVIDDVMMIQMDPALEEVTAAVWGIDHDATVAAVDAFLERYLDQFMAAATRAWDG